MLNHTVAKHFPKNITSEVCQRGVDEQVIFLQSLRQRAARSGILLLYSRVLHIAGDHFQRFYSFIQFGYRLFDFLRYSSEYPFTSVFMNSGVTGLPSVMFPRSSILRCKSTLGPSEGWIHRQLTPAFINCLFKVPEVQYPGFDGPDSIPDCPALLSWLVVKNEDLELSDFQCVMQKSFSPKGERFFNKSLCFSDLLVLIFRCMHLFGGNFG